jgi:hypothetical protein
VRLARAPRSIPAGFGGARITCGRHLTFHWSRRGDPRPYTCPSHALVAPRLSSGVRYAPGLRVIL